eukprot:12392749-Heterocapsa_arctica.AAC.1
MQLVGRVLHADRQQDRKQPRGVDYGCQGDGGHGDHGGGHGRGREDQGGAAEGDRDHCREREALLGGAACLIGRWLNPRAPVGPPR